MGFNPDFLNRPRKKQSPENHLVLQCIHYLRARGYEAYKIKTQGTPYKGRFLFDPYRLTGLGDLLAWKTPEQLIMCECKINRNKQTTNQIFVQSFWHYPPTRIYAVINSLEELQKIIKENT